MFSYLPQMSPMVPPSATVTRLISMKEELKASAGRKQNAKAAPEQLHGPHNATATTVPSCISSRRKSSVLIHVVHFLGLGRIMLLTVYVASTGRRGERRKREGQKQRSHSDLMNPSSLHKM